MIWGVPHFRKPPYVFHPVPFPGRGASWRWPRPWRVGSRSNCDPRWPRPPVALLYESGSGWIVVEKPWLTCYNLWHKKNVIIIIIIIIIISTVFLFWRTFDIEDFMKVSSPGFLTWPFPVGHAWAMWCCQSDITRGKLTQNKTNDIQWWYRQEVQASMATRNRWDIHLYIIIYT